MATSPQTSLGVPMSMALPLLILCAGADSPMAPGDIAALYRRAVAKHSQGLNTAVQEGGAGARRKARADNATQTLHRELEAVLSVLDRIDFTPDAADWIALSESSARLKKDAQAAEFAKRAVAADGGFDAYVVLVRSLCAIDRLEDAEAALAQASVEFPHAERLYLAHNLLAIAYRRLGQSQLAFGHLAQTISLTIEQLDQDRFYSTHLTRCLDQFQEIAGETSQEEAASEHAKRWNANLWDEIHRRSSVLPSKSNHPQIRSDLTALSVRYQAQASICCALLPDSLEQCLESWMTSLITLRGMLVHDEEWIGMVNDSLNHLVAFLVPEVDGITIESQLSDLLSLARALPSGNTRVEWQSRNPSDQIDKAIHLVRQHNRHRALIGQRLFEEVIKPPQAGLPDGAHQWVHIFNPTARASAASSSVLELFRRQFDKRGIVPVHYAPQIGLTVDASGRRISQSPRQGVAQEQIAVEKIGRALGLRTPVRLLPRDSAALKLLQVQYYPVHILLDSRGSIVGIATGAEKQKIGHLVRMTPKAKWTADN